MFLMARKKAVSSLACSLLLSFIISTTATHNISAILGEFADFTLLNRLLTDTGVADEINARHSLTLLAPSNDAMSAFTDVNLNISQDKLADVLRYHVLLSYVTVSDIVKLESGDFMEVPTLFRTTKGATGDDGDVNIYNTRSGRILIGHAVPDNYTKSSVVNTVYQQPLDINVIMIDRTLEPVGFAQAPIDGANITGILEGLGGFTTFVSLLRETGVDEIFSSVEMERGITIFVPTDNAFDDLPSGWLEGFELQQQQILLEYHSLTRYRPLNNLWRADGSLVPTLSSAVVGSYQLSIVGRDGVVTIVSSTPKDPKATLSSTLYDASPLVMYSVDFVLRPVELASYIRPRTPVASAPVSAADLAPAAPPLGKSRELHFPAVSPGAPPPTSATHVSFVNWRTLMALLAGVIFFGFGLD